MIGRTRFNFHSRRGNRMKRTSVLFLSFLLLALSVLRLVSAQAAQTGTMNGIIVDEQKQPLPGVTVVITSPQLITPQLSTVTSGQGFFRFAYLPPGRYTVTISLQGFSPYI